MKSPHLLLFANSKEEEKYKTQQMSGLNVSFHCSYLSLNTHRGINTPQYEPEGTVSMLVKKVATVSFINLFARFFFSCTVLMPFTPDNCKSKLTGVEAAGGLTQLCDTLISPS